MARQRMTLFVALLAGACVLFLIGVLYLTVGLGARKK